jgi:hypothetical protein
MTEWGYFVWYPEHGLHLVHPDDLAWLQSANVSGVVGMLTAQRDGWALFTYGAKAVRVAPTLVLPCAAPAFSYGQQVEVVPPRTHHVGEVSSIRWHFKRQEPFFLVGSKASRFFAQDLRAA